MKTIWIKQHHTQRGQRPMPPNQMRVERNLRQISLGSREGMNSVDLYASKEGDKLRIKFFHGDDSGAFKICRPKSRQSAVVINCRETIALLKLSPGHYEGVISSQDENTLTFAFKRGMRRE